MPMLHLSLSAPSGCEEARITTHSAVVDRLQPGQCVTVMASLVGPFDPCPHAAANTGMGGVFAPPDSGFPPTGVLAEGTLNQPGWTGAEVDLTQITHVRADGRVLGRAHWAEQEGRYEAVITTLLH